VRNHHDFHDSVEKIIDHKKSTNHIPISNDHTLFLKKLENHIIIRVTNGSSIHLNSVAIENIPGKIHTKRTIIAIIAIHKSTTGYVVAAINLFLNEYKNAYSADKLRNTVTKFPDDSHDLIIAISDAPKYSPSLIMAFVSVFPSFVEMAS
jgi:hypothetical protein